MRKRECEDRRLTLRLPEDIAKMVDKTIEISGISYTEWIRRACQEKLDRERGLSASLTREEIDEIIEAKIREVLGGQGKS